MKALGRVLFLSGLFLMLTGDFPRPPSEMRGPATLLLAVSWPGLHLVLLSLSFLIYAAAPAPAARLHAPAPLRHLLLPIGLVTAAISLSSALSLNRALSLEASSMFLVVLALLFLLWHLQERPEISAAIPPVLAIAAGFLAVRVILWRIREGFPLIPSQTIENSTWAGKLQISWVLNLLSPFLLCRFVAGDRGWRAKLGAAGWMLSAIAVLVLASRAGVVAFALSTSLYCILLWRQRRRWRTLLLLTLLATSPFAIKDSANIAYMADTTLHFYEQQGIVKRFGIWRETLSMIGDRPLTGVGFGTYDEVAYSRYHTPHDISGAGTNWFYRNGWHAHNLPLHTLAETGIVGLSGWCYLWFAILRRLRRAWRDDDAAPTRALVSATLCSLLALFTVSLTENLMAVRVHESLRMNLTVWFVIGSALSEIHRRVDGARGSSVAPTG